MVGNCSGVGVSVGMLVDVGTGEGSSVGATGLAWGVAVAAITESGVGVA